MMTIKPLRGLPVRKFYGRSTLIILAALSVLILHWGYPAGSTHWTDAFTSLGERKGRFPAKDYSLGSQQVAEGLEGYGEVPVSTIEKLGDVVVTDGGFKVTESFEPTHEVHTDSDSTDEHQEAHESEHSHEDYHAEDHDHSHEDHAAETNDHQQEDHSEEANSSDHGTGEDHGHQEASKTTDDSQHPGYSPIPCDRLEGAEDVVFIIKTGSTEVLEKLPAHFRTTLQCYPHHLIFSDYGEEIEGHEIIGALDGVLEDIRMQNDDFDLWRRLNATGRAALDVNELSTNAPGDPTGSGGNFENGGWRLDKFKNVPMVMSSLERNPDAKWFVFTDADTYIVWSNLLKWLPKFDHTQTLYIGSGAMIDDQVFAHGGSGYILSNPAMREVAELYRNQQEEWDRYAANHWAGDCVLAFALKKLGVELTWGYPIVQGGDPVTMDWTEIGYDKRIWCYPVVSYHHLTPQTVEDMWYVEQNWTMTTGETMRHSDVFKHYILPQMSEGRDDWNNLSEDVLEGVEVNDANGCRLVCTGNSTCMQYAYSEGRCMTYDKPKLGSHSSTGMHSGWMYERIQGLVQSLEHCDEGDWIVG